MDILGALFPLLILFAIFYFLVIRPQQKQHKEHKEMLDALQKGDKIVTNGGIIAEVVKVEEDHLKIKTDENTYLKLEKDFVAKKKD